MEGGDEAVIMIVSAMTARVCVQNGDPKAISIMCFVIFFYKKCNINIGMLHF